MANGDHRTPEQVRLDEHDRRLNHIEPLVNTAILGALGVGFVAGLFSKLVMKAMGL